MCKTAIVTILLLALPATAHAEKSFFEVVGGLSVPVGGSEGDAGLEYGDTVDESLKLGLRAGAFGAGKAGFEVALDWTPYNDELDSSFADVSLHRFRLQGGVRVGGKAAEKVMVFGRFLLGADIVRLDSRVEIPIIGTFEFDETDVGLALEIGGGVIVNLGSVALGGQIALPIAMHFDDDDPMDNEDGDFDYTAYDLDILFTVASTF